MVEILRGWDPDQYRAFARERVAPLDDLIALVETAPLATAVDLGCGPGEMTQHIANRLALSAIEGIDNSPAMLEAAAAYASEHVNFSRGDLATWSSEPGVDLIVANASLQWVPHHRDVLARWRNSLRPGGQLAVQVPANQDGVWHHVGIEVAAREPYRAAFGEVGPPPDAVLSNVLSATEYAQILYDLGFTRQRVSLRVYPHILPTSRHVVDWVQGSTLTRFAAVLEPELYQQFLEEYERELLARLGEVSPFFFGFARILMWGRLSGASPDAVVDESTTVCP